MSGRRLSDLIDAMDSDEDEDTWTTSPGYDFGIAQNLPEFDKDSSDEEVNGGDHAARGAGSSSSLPAPSKSPFFSPLKESKESVDEKHGMKGGGAHQGPEEEDIMDDEPVFAFDAAEVQKFLKKPANIDAIDGELQKASESGDSSVSVRARPSFISRRTSLSLEQSHMESPSSARRPTDYMKNGGDQRNTVASMPQHQISPHDLNGGGESPPACRHSERRSPSPTRATTPLSMSSYSSIGSSVDMTDSRRMNKLLMEVEVQSEQGVFKTAYGVLNNTKEGGDGRAMALSHGFAGIGGGVGEEKKGDLRVSLSPEYRNRPAPFNSPGSSSSSSDGEGQSVSPSSSHGEPPRATSPSPSVSMASTTTALSHSSSTFCATFFSPRDKRDVAVTALNSSVAAPALGETKAHVAPNSQYLFRKSIHKSVISAFERCAHERGDTLSRPEFDDFLVQMKLVDDLASRKHNAGAVFNEDHTKMYVAALRLGGQSAKEARASAGVTLEGAVGLLEIVHGIRELPTNLHKYANNFTDMKNRVRSLSTASKARLERARLREHRKALKAVARERGLVTHPDVEDTLTLATSTVTGDDESDVGVETRSINVEEHKNTGTLGSSTSPQDHSIPVAKVIVQRRRRERWRRLVRTEKAKFAHRHPFKPDMIAAPVSKKWLLAAARVAKQEKSSPGSAVTPDDNSQSSSHGTSTVKDVRSTEEREYDEHCTFSPKLCASEVAYDRAMLNLARRSAKKHKGEKGKDITIAVGGMYNRESGFIPGPPSRTNIPLYYYDPDHTPHWTTGKYDELGDTEITTAIGGGGPTASPGVDPNSGATLYPQAMAAQVSLTTPAATYESPGLAYGHPGVHLAHPDNSTSALGAPFSAGAGAGTPVPSSETVPVVTTSGGIPIAPRLPSYAFRSGGDYLPRKKTKHGTKSPGNDDSNGKDGTSRAPEKKPGIGASSKSPMEMVLAEMSKRFKDTDALDGDLKKISDDINRKGNKAVGRLGGVGARKKVRKRKVKKRGAADYGDVLDELSKRLARLRGEDVKDDSESSSEEEEEEEEQGRPSFRHSGDQLPLPAATSVGIGTIFVKDGDEGQGVEESTITDKLAVAPLDSRQSVPAPPALPSAWPPVPRTSPAAAEHIRSIAPSPATPGYSIVPPAVPSPVGTATADLSRHFLGMPGPPTAQNASPTGTGAQKLDLSDLSLGSAMVSPTSAYTPGDGEVSNSGPIVVAPGSLRQSAEMHARKVVKGLPLPEGYYQPIPTGTRILRHGIVKVGKVTSTTIREMKAAWRDLEYRSRLASADDGLNVPENYGEGALRLRRAREYRKQKEAEKKAMELRCYEWESEEEDYSQRQPTRPVPFTLHSDVRAKARAVVEEEDSQSRSGSGYEQSLHNVNQVGIQKGLSSDIRSGMRRNSMEFAVRLRDYSVHSDNARSNHDINGSPASSGVKQGAGAPALHSVASFARTKASRREREARLQYLDEHEKKKERQKNQRLREAAMATYGPARVNHAHERMLLKYSRTHPELLDATVEAHRDYGSHHMAIRFA